MRINAGGETSDEDIVAEFKCDTKDFLEQCMVSVSELHCSSLGKCGH